MAKPIADTLAERRRELPLPEGSRKSGFGRRFDELRENLSVVEKILRDREGFFVEIREGVGLRAKIRAMLVACMVFLTVFGFVMGLSHPHKLHAIMSMMKVPFLFLMSLAICTPSLHFFNIYFGSQQSASQMVALMLVGLSISSVFMCAFAPIMVFFLATSFDYAFYKFLNLTVLSVGGAIGIVFFRHGMRIVTEADNKQGLATRRLIFFVWVFVYGFVGLQMAWTLSPFIGDPNQPFILFQRSGSNVYTMLLSGIGKILGL
jgi:hypothetical protein